MRTTLTFQATAFALALFTSASSWALPTFCEAIDDNAQVIPGITVQIDWTPKQSEAGEEEPPYYFGKTNEATVTVTTPEFQQTVQTLFDLKSYSTRCDWYHSAHAEIGDIGAIDFIWGLAHSCGLKNWMKDTLTLHPSSPQEKVYTLNCSRPTE